MAEGGEQETIALLQGEDKAALVPIVPSALKIVPHPVGLDQGPAGPKNFPTTRGRS